MYHGTCFRAASFYRSRVLSVLDTDLSNSAPSFCLVFVSFRVDL